MAQIQLTIALVMIGLFSIAIIGFAINFATDNNAPIDISNDAAITSLYTQNEANITGFSTGASDTYQSILETSIAPGSGTAQSIGPFAITPTNALFVVKNIMEVAYIRVFGSDNGFNVFTTALISVIIFMFGLFVYKTLRGFPD